MGNSPYQLVRRISSINSSMYLKPLNPPGYAEMMLLESNSKEPNLLGIFHFDDGRKHEKTKEQKERFGV